MCKILDKLNKKYKIKTPEDVGYLTRLANKHQKNPLGFGNIFQWCVRQLGLIR